MRIEFGTSASAHTIGSCQACGRHAWEMKGWSMLVIVRTTGISVRVCRGCTDFLGFERAAVQAASKRWGALPGYEDCALEAHAWLAEQGEARP